MDENLIQKIDKMPVEEKKNLIMHLKNSIIKQDPKNEARDRYDQLLCIAETLFEYKMKNTRRDREDVMIRRVIAYKMKEEGFSYSAIGKAMKKNHATIVHLVSQMKDFFSLPKLYEFDIKQYNDFNELVSKIDSQDEEV